MLRNSGAKEQSLRTATELDGPPWTACNRGQQWTPLREGRRPRGSVQRRMT